MANSGSSRRSAVPGVRMKVGATADVAAAVIYLASPAAGLVTGTVLPVDGGWTAQ